MSEIVISLQDVRKRYGMNKVLKGVNLDINKGDICGLIGKNGSGKTTILKIILGLTECQSGNIHVGDEEDTLASGRAKIGFFIGMNFYPYMTGKQNLKYFCKIKGIKDRKEVNRVLELVGLKGVKTKFNGYSLGMKQRLGIANALLGNPEILVLDEPTNGLDPQGIADIRKLLKEINAEYGTTILISSHILSELQNTADHFAILDDGVITDSFAEEELNMESEFATIRLNAKDLRMAKEVLEHVGIEVLGEKKEKVSLEDYYFNAIQGKSEDSQNKEEESDYPDDQVSDEVSLVESDQNDDEDSSEEIILSEDSLEEGAEETVLEESSLESSDVDKDEDEEIEYIVIEDDILVE